MPDRKILGEATARLNIDTSDIAKNLTDALQGAQKTADKSPIIVSVDLKNKTIGSIKSGLYTYKKIFNETSKLQADIDKKKQQGYDKTAVANYIEEYLWNAWEKFNARKDKTHIEHQGDFIAAVQAAKALGFSNFQDDNKPIKTKYESLKNSFGYIPLKNIKDSESHLNLIGSSLNEIESRLQVIDDSIEKNAYYSAKTFIDEEQKKQNKIKQTTDVISEELKKQKLLGETIRLSTKNNLERFKVDLPSELFQEELSYGSSDKNLMIEFVGSGDNSGFSRELANKVYDVAQTKISDIDTSVHTHPENYIATPSYDDLEQFANLASDGVKKHIVAALGEVTTIDLSEIFKDDNYEISDKYYDAVKEYEDWYNDVFKSENFSKEDNANLKNIETRLKSLYDYNRDDARLQFDTDNVFMRNKLMSIFEKYGLSNIIKTTKISNVYDNDNFEQIKNNASSIFAGLLPLTKEDRQSFISLQDNINSLSDIKVNTDSVDKLKASADSVTESLKEINSAFDSNTLSNGLSEIGGDLKSIETQAKETENAVDNINQHAFVFNDEAFKNDVEQTQVSLKTSKEAAEELLEERRRLLNQQSQSSFNTQDKNDSNIFDGVSTETQNFKSLETQVDKVTEAVDRKTRAFKEEEQVVIGIAQREVNELDILLGEISLIQKELRESTNTPIKIDTNANEGDEIINKEVIESLEKIKSLLSTDSTWIKDLSQLSKSIKDFHIKKSVASNLIDFTIALNEFVQELNNVDLGKTTFLTDINALLDKGDQLQNFASILRSKEVSKALSAQKKEQKSKKDEAPIDYVEKARKAMTQLRADFSKLVDTNNFKKIVNPIDAQANNVTTKEGFEQLAQSIAIARKELTVFQKQQKDGWQSTSFKNMSDALDHYKKNLNATIKSSVEDSDGSIKEFTAEFRDAENQLVQVRVAANGAERAVQELVKVKPDVGAWGKFTGQIGETFKYFKHYLTGYFSLQEVIQAVRYGVRSIVELDTAMTELRKVSKDSSYAIDNYFSVATESAKELGATVGDVLNATADWSRMGYNLADAKELAEVSTLYMHVGDGIDIDQASSSLVSTMKGFHLEAQDAMEIIDKFNEVANTNPIESGGIGEALQRSAASFYTANTDLSSAIALITAANSVIQDPEKVGNMWKTVSARIRGAATEVEAMGEDTEGMVESTSKLREQIMAMTGFDIMKDENTFKDMREIIVGIGKEWENLSDIDQAALLEKLAGKNHANTLAAALSQYEMIEDVYQTAENSEGSALEEQAEYMKSLQYSIDKGKATVQEFWSTLLDSGFLKSALDFGTKALDIFTELIDTLGTVPTLMTTTLPLLQNTKFFPKDFRLTYVTCHGILVPYYI